MGKQGLPASKVVKRSVLNFRFILLSIRMNFRKFKSNIFPTTRNTDKPCQISADDMTPGYSSEQFWGQIVRGEDSCLNPYCPMFESFSVQIVK